MIKDDKQHKELLNQLTIKLAATAHQLGEAARRLQLAELTYREYLGRLRKLDEHMLQPAAQETNTKEAAVRRLHRVLELRRVEKIREDAENLRRRDQEV